MVRGSVSTHLEPQSVPSVLAWLIHHYKVKPYIEDFTHEQVRHSKIYLFPGTTSVQVLRAQGTILKILPHSEVKCCYEYLSMRTPKITPALINQIHSLITDKNFP